MRRRSPPRPAEVRRLGKQAPRYRFFLNRYVDARFTSCPQCRGRMRVRKLPLVIQIDPMQLVALNKTCRYCSRCDLLIAHRDQIEAFLTVFLGQSPGVFRDHYLIVGTEDRADWLRGMRSPATIEDALECLHDFAEVVDIRPSPNWVPVRARP